MAMLDDSLLGIDINYDRFVEWCVSRRKIPVKWIDGVRLIRQKISIALKETFIHISLPKELKFITKQQDIEQEPLNYFQCVRILEVLEKQDETQGSKTIFGQYNSTTLRLWDEIIHLYEKDRIYLGECAKIMEQNSLYDIPALRKDIHEQTKEINNLDKKIISMERTQAQYEEGFSQGIKELGIKGLDIRNEIKDSASGPELGAILDDIAEFLHASVFHQAITYYRLFAEQTIELEDFLPFLSNMDSDEDAPTHPSYLEQESLEIQQTQETTSSDCICWDVMPLEKSEPEIASPPQPFLSSESELKQINWEVGLPSAGQTLEENIKTVTDIQEEIASDSIVWDITVETMQDVAATTTTDSYGISSSLSPLTRKLFDADSQHRLLNDLLELHGFLDQCCFDLKRLEVEERSNTLSISTTTRFLVQKYNDSKSIENFLNATQSILTKLRSPRLIQLLLFRSSSTYVNRLAHSLESKRAYIQKFSKQIREVRKTGENLRKSTQNKAALLDSLVKYTKDLEDKIKTKLSEEYGGRPVHFIGATF